MNSGKIILVGFKKLDGRLRKYGKRLDGQPERYGIRPAGRRRNGGGGLSKLAGICGGKRNKKFRSYGKRFSGKLRITRIRATVRPGRRGPDRSDCVRDSPVASYYLILGFLFPISHC
jgi:hypothetical protein